MLDAKLILFLALGVFIAVYVTYWAVSAWRRHAAGEAGAVEEEGKAPAPLLGAIGFVVNFFDTLGIGSFATTTSIVKLGRLVPDRLIPGTLNVGFAAPTFVQAFFFIKLVKVDMRTLVLMIVASVAGAWLGAGVVAAWPRRKIQIGMGVALLCAAGFITYKALEGDPVGGATLGVIGTRLTLAIIGNFVLGALMTLGIGLYAPCMVLVSLLGMNPKVAFPIMMGSCAFLMPVASIRFIQKRSYAPRASFWLALAGIPAVIAAVYLIWELPINAVRWLVVCVVVYTAVAMLRSARIEKAAAAAAEVVPQPTLDPPRAP